MGRFLLKRLGQTVITLFIVSIISFSLIQFIPGDPVYTMMGTDITPEYHDQIYEEMGLNKPVYEQYISWLVNLFQGDMGYSYYLRADVSTVIAKRLPTTLCLGVTSAIVSVIIGIAFGVVSAVKRQTLLDRTITIFANIGVAMPSFWLVTVMVLIFSINLGWLPATGYTLPWVDLAASLRQSILPVFCMSLGGIASYTRQTRSSMLEVINQDYIRTARSKGLKEGQVISRHAIKNGLIPILTLAGTTLRGCIGGSAIIETMFNIVGMGQVMVTAVNKCDYQLLQSSLFFMAAITCGCNLLVDIAYGIADPRVRLE
ncbi:MAG: ABC transporter permease [Firmicutes bacterium]|nr:ABC transporter permease [Bacillota bacterium]